MHARCDSLSSNQGRPGRASIVNLLPAQTRNLKHKRRLVAERAPNRRRVAGLPSSQQLCGSQLPWPTTTVAVGTYFVATLALRSGSGVLIIVALIAIYAVAIRLHQRHNYSAGDILILSAPFSFYSPFGPHALLTITDLLLPLYFGLSIGRATNSRASPNRTNGVPPGLIIGLIAIQVVYLAGLLIAAMQFQDTLVGVGAFNAVKLAIAGAYVVLLYHQLTKDGTTAIPRALSLWSRVAVLVSVVAIVAQALHSVGIDIGLSYQFRALGPFEDPNAFAVYLGVSAGITMAASWQDRYRAFTARLIPILGALLLTGSRAALLSLAFANLAVFVLAGFRRVAASYRVTTVAALALAAALVVALPSHVTGLTLNRALGALNESDLTQDVRFSQWRAALKLWERSPIVGYGPGQFRPAAESVLGYSTDTLAHSTYLSLLAEVGLLGTVVVLLVPATTLIRVMLARGRVAELRPFFMFAFFFAIIMAATLNLENNRQLWLFTAIALACIAQPTPASSFPDSAINTREGNQAPVPQVCSIRRSRLGPYS